MLRIAASVLLLASISNADTRAATACIADWSVAAPIVHKEGLTTVEALSRIAAERFLGSIIVRTALCEDGGHYFYRMVMRDEQGRLSTHSVDARAPFNR